MIWTTDGLLFLLGLMLLVGVVGAKMTNKLNVPSLVLFIVLGMALNPFIYYDNANRTQLFGILALIVILFEGGMHTNWSRMRPILSPALSLSTIGVAVTAGLVGVCAKFILQLDWLEGLLIGAIVGSTDAAAVFSVLGGKPIRRTLKATLEAESGTNDPMAVFLTITIITLIQQQEAISWVRMIVLFVWQMGAGLLLGLLFGYLSVQLLNRIRLDNAGLYPVLAIGLGIFSYSGAAIMECSGFLTVYVMAIILGNADLTYRFSIIRFNEGFSWMMQIMMFILLGLLVFPQQLLGIAWQGMALSLILMFIARPIGVWLSLLFTKFNRKEKTLIAWAGLKGAVPIILATYPLTAHLENGKLFFNVIFFVVLTSALLQGATISPLAGKLGLARGRQAEHVHTIELLPGLDTHMDMICLKVWAGSVVEHATLAELTLPMNTSVTAVMRDTQVIAPNGATKFQAGDMAYVLIAKHNHEQVKAMFQRHLRHFEDEDDE
ncbi:potassium/proton antiporter [Paenibacillus sp. ACRRX]|uniref:potassium/proton antiporter n=1 Tax=Paenibacillus sp. ACRRX TaxID=2918206 RepID=UPI001EF4264E|nr:potassium/proton antiporter [Paenibacillus sp. ACRRX]MCG7408854.1 potassium/proton antiporter [Paenibacillus sp. ACRRX]